MTTYWKIIGPTDETRQRDDEMKPLNALRMVDNGNGNGNIAVADG